MELFPFLRAAWELFAPTPHQVLPDHYQVLQFGRTASKALWSWFSLFSFEFGHKLYLFHWRCPPSFEATQRKMQLVTQMAQLTPYGECHFSAQAQDPSLRALPPGFESDGTVRFPLPGNWNNHMNQRLHLTGLKFCNSWPQWSSSLPTPCLVFPSHMHGSGVHQMFSL